MVEFIYAVPLNGILSSPWRYKVIKETPKTFVLEYGAVVRKATMSTIWERFFVDKAEAEEFIAQLLYSIKHATQRIDVRHVYNELRNLQDKPDFYETRLKELIVYVEDFL